MAAGLRHLPESARQLVRDQPAFGHGHHLHADPIMDLNVFSRLPLAAVLALLACMACSGAAPAASKVPSTALVASSGSTLDARELVAGAPFTVFIFFSSDCHCLNQHD